MRLHLAVMAYLYSRSGTPKTTTTISMVYKQQTNDEQHLMVCWFRTNFVVYWRILTFGDNKQWNCLLIEIRAMGLRRWIAGAINDVIVVIFRFFSGFGWKHWAAPETDSNHLCVCAFLLFDQKDDNISQIWIFGQILFCLFQYLLRTTLCEIPSNCLIYLTYTKILLEPVHNSHVRPNNKKN